MAINTTNSTSSAIAQATATNGVTNPNGQLKKNDFLKLLLTQLQYQDPTAPTNTEKILTQTSQLATLEASTNTQKALDQLATSLGTAQQFSTIAAIGKTADLGSDAITLNKGKSSTFEVYFPQDVKNGSVVITDNNGATVKTLDVGTNPSGVYKFTWDGSNTAGNALKSGIYHVNATYSNPKGKTLTTRLGAYPIESVKFDKGNTLVKVGSNYVPLNNIKEVY